MNDVVVNTACAERIVRSKDSNLLASNGGHINFFEALGKASSQSYGVLKRRASTKAKVAVQDFVEVKAQFLLVIKVVIEIDEISIDQVINWDQTGIHYVPLGSWKMEKEG